MKPRVLVVDDERTIRLVLQEALADDDLAVTTAASIATAIATWAASEQEIVIVDRALPDGDGLDLLVDLLHRSRARQLDTLVLVASASADAGGAIRALRLGAFEYLIKPLALSDVLLAVRRAAETWKLRTQVRELTDAANARFDQFVVGPSAAMTNIAVLLDQIVKAPDLPVLLQGESGTGKDLLAHLIHRRTEKRRESPLLTIDCSSTPESTLEHQLFGGSSASPSVDASPRSVLERATGGTLLLEHIDALAMRLQSKLAKLLSAQELRATSGVPSEAPDVRFIVAIRTSARGQARRDQLTSELAARLAAFDVHIPPLRDRPKDVVPLAQHFLARFGRELGGEAKGFLPRSERRLQRYPYPGNVRELRTIVERAAVLALPSRWIGPEHLMLGRDASADGEDEPFFAVDLCEGSPPTLEDLERRYIARVLAFASRNRTRAARLLGISYPTIAKKVHAYGLMDQEDGD
jgi:two-component system response regulator AtoC